MDVKSTGLEIAEALAEVEEEGVTPANTKLHRLIRRAMYNHRELLGLTDEDVAEIDNLGPLRRSGEPKEAISPDTPED